MESILSLFPANLYGTIYIVSIFIFCCMTSWSLINSNDNKIFTNGNNQQIINILFSLLFISVYVIFLGYRSERGFVDSLGYSILYDLHDNYVPVDWSNEWLFVNYSFFCKQIGLSVSGYFLVTMILYTGCMFICSILLMRRNVWLAMLFWISSLSFFGYATNGIRNGMACSILIFAVAIIVDDGIWKKILAIVLMIIAYGIHRSTFLPSICCLSAVFVLKDPKYSIYIWLVSIPFSFLVGNVFGDMFAAIGFADRSSYLENTEIIETTEMSLNTRFRWDFLIYSSLPVILVWYLTVKRNFKDKTYNVIATTYILANAFWIMVIRSEYSNRFAYLSWFIYPLIIAYPLIRFNIWEHQNRKVGAILLLYSGFTLFMSLIYKSI